LVSSPTFPLRQVCRQAAAADIYMLKGVREASLWRGRLDDLVSSVLSAFRLLVTYSRTRRFLLFFLTEQIYDMKNRREREKQANFQRCSKIMFGNSEANSYILRPHEFIVLGLF
jgi:hypothetical protein